MAYNPKMFDSITPKDIHDWAAKLDPNIRNGFAFRGFDPGETEPEHQSTFGRKKKRRAETEWSETAGTFDADVLRDAIDKMNGVTRDNSIRDEAKKGLVIDGTCRRK